MKKVIVTGANGFVGSYLVKELTENGYFVFAVVRNENSDISSLVNLTNIKIIYCELSEIETLTDKIFDRDIIAFFHLAWSGSSGNLRSDYKLQLNNVKWSCDAVSVAARLKCELFIAVGSTAEVDTNEYAGIDGATPSKASIYGSAKLSAHYMTKALCNDFGIKHIWARLSNVYGIGDSTNNFVNFASKLMLNGKKASFTAGEQFYDFIYVLDAARGLRYALEKGKNNVCYLIGSNNKWKLKDYIYKIRNEINKDIPLFLGEIPFNGVSLAESAVDCSKLMIDTGYKPLVSFEEGIKKTIEWLKPKKSFFSVKEGEISGLKIITPFYTEDDRGYFLKSFERDILCDFETENDVFETFETFSKKGVIRGLHFQIKEPQAKFIRVINGKIFDVAVDLRKNSSSFGQWQGIELSGDNREIFYIPRGFAHGFQVLSETALVSYHCVGKFIPEYDNGIIWNDSDINILWREQNYIISEKDNSLKSFKDFKELKIEFK